MVAIEVKASEHYERKVLNPLTQLRKAFDGRAAKCDGLLLKPDKRPTLL